jgi:hypothetical protein
VVTGNCTSRRTHVHRTGQRNAFQPQVARKMHAVAKAEQGSPHPELALLRTRPRKMTTMQMKRKTKMKTRQRRQRSQHAFCPHSPTAQSTMFLFGSVLCVQHRSLHSLPQDGSRSLCAERTLSCSVPPPLLHSQKAAVRAAIQGTKITTRQHLLIEDVLDEKSQRKNNNPTRFARQHLCARTLFI